MVRPLWRTVWRFLKKFKIELPYDPRIALLGICPKDTDAVKRWDTCTPMFTAAMFTIVKLSRSLGVHRQMMNLEAVVYVYNGIFLSHQK